MIQYSIVTEQPDSEPVTLDEAKDHLEYTGTLKDEAIQSMITAARRICEKYTGLSFVTCERSVKMDRFPCYYDPIIVPYGPVQAILTFTYFDSNQDEITLTEGTDFEMDNHSRVCRLYAIDSNGQKTSWPTALYKPNAITITYQAGYDDASGEVTPEEARIGIKRVLAKLFENRGDTSGKDGIIDWDTQTILDGIKVTWNANYD